MAGGMAVDESDGGAPGVRQMNQFGRRGVEGVKAETAAFSACFIGDIGMSGVGDDEKSGGGETAPGDQQSGDRIGRAADEAIPGTVVFIAFYLICTIEFRHSVWRIVDTAQGVAVRV
ncbi:hypothetical protein SDC9_206481 [bioreactor metagenome]|uniref:Uncharacterized protein n=1 Tax=bioreactor metagenome TaxID=1076179 RepID=A0A645J551_9ZZZZ